VHWETFEYDGAEHFFPTAFVGNFKKHLKDGITRLTLEELPELEVMQGRHDRGWKGSYLAIARYNAHLSK